MATTHETASPGSDAGRYSDLPPHVPLDATVGYQLVDEQPFGGPEGGGDADGD